VRERASADEGAEKRERMAAKNMMAMLGEWPRNETETDGQAQQKGS